MRDPGAAPLAEVRDRRGHSTVPIEAMTFGQSVFMTADRLFREEGPVLIPGGRTGSLPADLRSFPAGFADRLRCRRLGRERRIAFEPCRPQPRDLRIPRIGFGGNDRLRCGVGALRGLAGTGSGGIGLGRSHSCSLFRCRDRSFRAGSGGPGGRANMRCLAICAAPGSGLLRGAGTGRRREDRMGARYRDNDGRLLRLFRLLRLPVSADVHALGHLALHSKGSGGEVPVEAAEDEPRILNTGRERRRSPPYRTADGSWPGRKPTALDPCTYRQMGMRGRRHKG
ncbi:hypothetical protein SAMN05421763_10416 [[Luteovulum] sphaeroides subsp. megalophilum]|nr:hypothetical protein EBL87_13230 [Cereibacter sphaeroides]AZB67411.1 hypothetical protein EBL86_02945 [Cereibacter sphaeroides]SNT00624.1 hypothetical protein SAMN05421763_10416 [[Luteovulum] sphaeroides subsp. megalophilum]